MEIEGTAPIVASKGEGTLRSSMDVEWHNPQTAGQIYRAYCYWRTDAATVSVGGSSYVALNSAAMDGSQSAMSIFNPDYPFSEGAIKGEGWIVSFSAANVTAEEELVIGFSTSSSATGPRDFAIDWGESLDGTFTMIGEYQCTNWSAQLYGPEFMFTLPAECNGKENIVVRLRVNGTRRANLNATNTVFASGGTNRLCGLVVSKRAK
jgi:hypothetical protein